MRAVPISTASCITVALLLLSADPEKAAQPFVRHLLTVGDLSEGRIAPSGKTRLFRGDSYWSYWQMLCAVAAHPDTILQLSPANSLAVLLNVALIAAPRLAPSPHQAPSMAVVQPRAGSDIVALLTVLESCFNHVSTGGNLVGVTRASDDMDVDDRTTFEAAGDYTPRQAQEVIFTHLCRSGFLSHLVAYSTRYAATSRQAMSQMLVALLQAVPSQKEQLINTLVYSTGATATSSGLIRELWRGYIRSSSLNRNICTSIETRKGTGITSLVYAAIQTATYAKEWPHVILLAELYNRTLLTLGDDEFFSVPTANTTHSNSRSGNARSAAGANSASRNPLLIDEVIGLSAFFRNVAFALHWQAQSTTEAALKQAFVAGTRVSLDALRKLSTQLLQAIYIREYVFLIVL